MEKETNLNCSVIRICHEWDVLRARKQVVGFAMDMGFREIEQAELEIVVSELGTNLIKHTRDGGRITMGEVAGMSGKGIEIVAENHQTSSGNDFADMGRGLEDGISTTGTLGIGLSGARRLMDEFDVTHPSGQGICIVTRKWLTPASIYRVNCSAISRPRLGERQNGDAVFIRHMSDMSVFGVIDALGHGPEAAEVSRMAVNILEFHCRKPITDLLLRCHEHLARTRGAAVAACRFDYKDRRLHHLSIGNVETTLYNHGEPLRLVCHHGTLGAAMPHVTEQIHFCRSGQVVVMHSDGISDKFVLEPAMLQRTPTEISHWIAARFSRDYDDASVLVVKL